MSTDEEFNDFNMQTSYNEWNEFLEKNTTSDNVSSEDLRKLITKFFNLDAKIGNKYLLPYFHEFMSKCHNENELILLLTLLITTPREDHVMLGFILKENIYFLKQGLMNKEDNIPTLEKQCNSSSDDDQYKTLMKLNAELINKIKDLNKEINELKRK